MTEPASSKQGDCRLARWSSIRAKLGGAFGVMGVLMIVGWVTALVQLNLVAQKAQYLYEADQPARDVLIVRSEFLGYQQELQRLATQRDADQLAVAAERLRRSFDAAVERATRSLRILPPGSQRETELSGLDTVRRLFADQVESLSRLAHAGDWPSVKLRLESRMTIIGELSDSLVNDIETIVELERRAGLESIRRAQRDAVWALVGTSAVALVIAGVIGLRVTRSIAGRLGQLDAAARTLTPIAASRVAVVGHDEIARLGETFNQMSARLHALYGDLRQSEAHFRALIENARDFILVVDRSGVIRYASPSMERDFSDGRGLVGQELFRLVARDEADAVRRAVEGALSPALSGALAQFSLKASDGSLRVLEASGRALVDDPVLSGVVLNARDVTERMRMEEQLRHSQRLEAIGTLSGGVAHDFNNLLTIIRGYTQELLESLDGMPEARLQAVSIDEAAARAAALTQQLLAFSRRQVLQPSVFDLAGAVRGVYDMLRRLIGENIELVTITPDTASTVRADRGQVEQVIVNLVVNARDAMPGGGKLTLETSTLELDEVYAATHAGAVPGPFVMLAISDTGEGMTADTQAHIFEPFFTTKTRGRGTGLGLSTVYGIVSQSGGHICVHSTPGRGTTFQVYLPRVDEHAADREGQADLLEPGRPGDETVLVVEDEPQIKILIERVLKVHGYRVLAAENGEDAVAMSDGHGGPIDLLVTDVVLPGMSGLDVARQITARRPGTKVLFTSGYTTDAIVHHGVFDAELHFLQKPFTIAALIAKVRGVLDQDRPGARAVPGRDDS